MFQGSTVEGCMPSNQRYKFREQLKKGSIYRVESFIVSVALNKYMTPDHPYQIEIGQRTKVIEAIPDPENFPLFVYNVKSFHVLHSRIENIAVISGSQ
jgi:hypothetical protein